MVPGASERIHRRSQIAAHLRIENQHSEVRRVRCGREESVIADVGSVKGTESFGRRFRYPRRIGSRAVRAHDPIRMPGLASNLNCWQLERALSVFLDDYNGWRRYRSLDLAPPNGRTPTATWTAQPIRVKRRDRLGGRCTSTSARLSQSN